MIEVNRIKDGLLNDVAIICIKRESWMDGLKSFEINKCSLGEHQVGYGFPESTDIEVSKKGNTILSGKSNLDCKITNVNKDRYVFEYEKKVYEYEITRDQ